MPSRPARRRWFQSWRVRPTSSWPSARSMAATAEESTPPDIATAITFSGIGRPTHHSLIRQVGAGLGEHDLVGGDGVVADALAGGVVDGVGDGGGGSGDADLADATGAEWIELGVGDVEDGD